MFKRDLNAFKHYLKVLKHDLKVRKHDLTWFKNIHKRYKKQYGRRLSIISSVTAECRVDYIKEKNTSLANIVEGDTAIMIFARTAAQPNSKKFVSSDTCLKKIVDKEKGLLIT